MTAKNTTAPRAPLFPSAAASARAPDRIRSRAERPSARHHHTLSSSCAHGHGPLSAYPPVVVFFSVFGVMWSTVCQNRPLPPAVPVCVSVRYARAVRFYFWCNDDARSSRPGAYSNNNLYAYNLVRAYIYAYGPL